MSTDDQELRRGERWVVQLDPDTGRITHTVEQNWLLAPFYGLWELVSDISHRRLGTADALFLAVLVVLIARGAG